MVTSVQNIALMSHCIIRHKARRSRFLVSHQPLSQLWCGRVVIIHYMIMLKWPSLKLFINVFPDKTLEKIYKITSRMTEKHERIKGLRITCN